MPITRQSDSSDIASRVRFAGRLLARDMTVHDFMTLIMFAANRVAKPDWDQHVLAQLALSDTNALLHELEEHDNG